MKTRKPKADSPFWHPTKVGDSIKGKFLSFQPTSLGLAAQLDTGLVGLGAVLKRSFGRIRADLKTGDRIEIVFTGMAKRAKLFDLFHQGKKVPGLYAPATPDQVEAFFTAEEAPKKKGKRSKK
jgi:hypothetical protein